MLPGKGTTVTGVIDRKPMKQAADVLGITTRTVAFHKYRIMAALGIKSSAELVRFAVQNRLV